MNQLLKNPPSSKEVEIDSHVSLLEMRTAQYRQRIEVLEATLRINAAQQAAMEKLIDHLQVRISATENHCSWTTERFKELEASLHLEPPPPSLKKRLKARLVLPLLRRALPLAVKAAGLLPGTRDAAAHRLYERHRSVYDQLRQIAPTPFMALEASTRNPTWRAQLQSSEQTKAAGEQVVLPLRQVPNTRAVVLSNPQLDNLPRPLDAVLQAFSVAAIQQDEQLKEITRLAQVHNGPVSVGFVVFVRGQDAAHIDRTLQSIFRQTDPSWELLLCAGHDPDETVESWLDRDWRIRRVPAQGGEIEALCAAAGLSTSSFLGLITPGDVIDDDLVKRIGQLVSQREDLVAVYTDEARQSADGSLTDTFYKPDWSPDHQLSVNVLGRFLAVRKSLLLGLPREPWQTSAAAEYLLGLRLVGQSAPVGHLQDILYLREAATGAEAGGSVGGRLTTTELKAAAPEVARYLQQTTDAGAVVLPDAAMGALRVRWSIPPAMPVTLVILSNMRYRTVEGRGNILMVLNFVQSIIEKSTYPDYKLIVVDDGYVPDELKDLLRQHGHSTATYRAEGEFSFAGKSNFASSLVPSGIVVLLNDDLEVIATDWIEALVEQASRPEVAVVGGKLLFPDESIQHAGIAIGLNGSAGHVFMGLPPDSAEYAGYASVVRNYGAVTGALMAYRKEIFDSVGGFDEFFRVDYNDTDFCLRCLAKGYRVVFTPYAKLYHFHNSTFNRKHDMGHERAEFLRRWQAWVDLDPYCGTHLAPLCRENNGTTT